MSRVFVLHENSAWLGPLRAAFEEIGAPYEEWFLDQGIVPFDGEPPVGVFYNRMSASSHTRDHRFGPELTHVVLNWLEARGRRVVNGRRALYLEISKIAQYAALQRFGIRTPRSVAAVGESNLLAAARGLDRDRPFILKPNRGGRGVGVRLYASADELEEHLNGSPLEPPVDGVWLLQEYVQAAEPFITRCEFIGGRFLYAVRVETGGGFELCPADACHQGPGQAGRFSILEDLPHRELIADYERFLAANGIEVAGIEFVTDPQGNPLTYDVNTNTNYNDRAEAEAGLERGGMQTLARFLAGELGKL